MPIDSSSAFKTWCPTAVHFDRTVVEKAWDFCLNENKPDCYDQNKYAEEDICQTKQSLEDLVSKMPDLSRLNPKKIAESLDAMGSPFSCNYLDYTAELLSSWSDPRLEENTLKVVLSMGNDGASQTVLKDLDYNLDMFISDIGTSFGLLLGLSLSGLMSNVQVAARSLFGKDGTIGMKYRLGSLLDLLKWTSVLTTLAILIGQAVSRDFLNFSQSSSDNPAIETFNLDLASMETSFNKCML